MKPLRRTDSTSQSCSCTSCLYKSESEQPSIRRYVAHGSRIDRLYYGKYIPLRERKLLDRLVRTRAVYDDLRARLITESTSSLEKKPDLKPRKHNHAIKTLNDTNKGSAILEFVDLVDKGVALGPKKLSECCSCCSCSSKVPIEGDKKEHRSRHVYEGRYSRKVQNRIGERYNRRGVHFKAKHIRSDPCTCTLKFSGLIKRHSKAMLHKLRHLPREEPLPIANEQDYGIVEESKLKNIAKKSYKKYKESRTRLKQKLEQDIKKVNESKTNIKENLLLRARKSLEHMKQATDNLKSSLQSEIPVRPMEKPLESCECPVEETNFEIKKDSIVKFRDHLKRKEITKDWECDFECEPDECVPEECFKIKKLGRSHNRNRGRDQHNEYNIKSRGIKVGGPTISRSNISIQAQKRGMHMGTDTKKRKVRVRTEGDQVAGHRLMFESKRVKENIKQDLEHKQPKLNQLKMTTARPNESSPKIIISKEEKVRNVRYKGRHRQKGSQVILKPSLKTSAMGVRTSKQVKIKRHKHSAKLKKVNVAHSVSSTTQDAAFECAPYLCLPGQCDPVECEKQLSNVKTNTGHRTKSATSVTTKLGYNMADQIKNTSLPVNRRNIISGISVPLPRKPIDNISNTSQKQAVRIGSTFSFSVEFYKNANNKDEGIPPPNKIIVERGKKKNYAPRRLVKVKTSLTKSKYTQAKDTLQKCFCRLKLHKFGKSRKKDKFSKGTVTSFVNRPKVNMVSKLVETDRRKGQYKHKLLPYECEPGICIPGECNPVLCDKIIQLRHGKRRTRSSYTSSRKTRSTSSLASRAIVPVKAKIVQSSIVEHRESRRKRENLEIGQKALNNMNKPRRQAVRIGSSFSFDIEFYKDRPSRLDMTSISTTPKTTVHNKPKLMERGYRESKRRNKSMYTHMAKNDKSIETTLKRCFCTLKLYKKKIKKEADKQKNNITADTQTMAFIPSVAETIDKGTKTRWKQNYNFQLQPLECEPFTCVPGECDPYLCLEKNKRREMHLTNYGVYTNTPKMISVSSFTGNINLKSIGVIAQPKSWRKGTNATENYSNLVPTYPRRSGVSFANSKQTVKIGSSFSFSVEFSKRRPLSEVSLKTQVIEKQNKKHRLKVHKNKGIKRKKVRAGDVNIQVMEARKVNKSSLVRPMLKRCFCTLNLQKRIKQQDIRNNSTSQKKLFTNKMYTVSTAMATNTQIVTHRNMRMQSEAKEIDPSSYVWPVLSKSASSFLLKKYYNSTSKYSALNLCPIVKLPIHLRQPIKINSNFSVEVEFVRELGSYKNSQSCDKRALDTEGYKQIIGNSLKNSFIAPGILSQSSNIGIRQYLERCFCTMNIHIDNVSPGRRNRYSHLEPYECEPGICIPGECDPYECQKRIMKRLMTNVNKSSGTDTSNRSISSFTSQSKPGSKSTQLKSHLKSHSQEFRPKLRRQKDKRLIKSNQKQAVRVSSTFSFDVEFSKNSTHRSRNNHRIVHDNSTREYKIPVKKKAHRVNNVGAQESRILDKNQHSQSTTSSVHRGSNSLPMMKRCFCTLKLQKKGRMQREQMKIRHKHPEKELPSIKSRNIKVGTRKAKYQSVPQHEPYDLKPYECEPNICIPGQCNPYECLELIKKRKQLGVNTTPYLDKSISSTTSDSRYPRGKHKNLATDFKAKKMLSKGIKGLNYIKKDNSQERGSRQAVRIGSNFSFNIEFYKDSPRTTNGSEKIELMQKISKKDARQKKPRKELRGNFTQSGKEILHRDTQIDRPTNQMSTMTSSFLKRCFCTAKLRGIENLHHDTSTSPSFMQRCFCLLGLKNKTAGKSHPPQTRIQTADKITNTNYRPKPLEVPRGVTLEPYECEPGICIPGLCDPYVCDKIIQQRIAKQHTKVSETESIRTHSVSSSYGFVKQPRDKRTQAHVYKRDKQINQHSRKMPHTDHLKLDNDKRVVRIGSNFSFNVEFYKEKLNESGINEEPKIRTYQTREAPSKIKVRKSPLKSTGTESFGPVLRNHDSQIRRDMKSSGVSPILKRCFCTLKLLNKSNRRQNMQANKNNKLANNPMTKNAETQSNKYKRYKCDPHECQEIVQDHQMQIPRMAQVLLPYECEPMTCIPGECDPEECLARIKRRRRQMKNYGTDTENPRNRSIGSITFQSKRDEHLQAMFPSYKHKTAKTQSKAAGHYDENPVISSNRSRQAVRIGSNFSFNIEFFKDRINDDSSKPVDLQPQQHMKKKRNIPRSPKYHKRNQLRSLSRDADSQVIAENMQSTETGMPKRCFCTLQLRNKQFRQPENSSIKTQHGSPNVKYQPKTRNSAVGQFLQRCICALKFHKVGKLKQQQLPPTVKYQIKGTSTPRRNARLNEIENHPRLLEPYECKPNVCIPGECDPYECLKRIQKKQVRHFGTDYKRSLKDFGTDSIKGPITKCTEAQCIRKKRLKSHGTSLSSKRMRDKEQATRYVSYPSQETNRQAVRIGSNFSFNVEFFKERGPTQSKYEEYETQKVLKNKTRPRRFKTMSRGFDSIGKSPQCQSSQCPYRKRETKSSTAHMLPKRCFCTLQLQKRAPRTKVINPQPVITTEDKMTATKNKYMIPHELGVYECPPLMCIPGECDPYECLDKMKRRGLLMRKSRTVGTRTLKRTATSVGNGHSKLRTHKVQSTIVNNKTAITSTPRSEPQSEILKSPRFLASGGDGNKQAVKIGSNFSFDVKFFKQKSRPTVIRTPKIVTRKDEGSRYFNKDVSATSGNYRHYSSQVEGIRTRSQGSDAGNMLKRCFCTLQLQKSARQRQTRIMPHSGIKVKYPQIITVGRVTVEPRNKCYCNAIMGGAMHGPDAHLKTVSTKIHKQYLQNENNDTALCNPNNCQKLKKQSPNKIKETNDMQTILPYTPSKFNKKHSKTLVSDKNKVQKILDQSQYAVQGESNPRNATFNKGKRLTAKKSKKSIPVGKFNAGKAPSIHDSFLCRCAKLFSRRKINNPKGAKKKFIHQNVKCNASCNDNLKSSKSERNPPQFKLTIIPKTSKSVKLTKEIANETCVRECPRKKETEKYSKFQSGDTVSKTAKSEGIKRMPLQFDDLKCPCLNDNQNIHVFKFKQPKLRVTFAESTKHSSNDIPEQKAKRLPSRKSNSTRAILCYTCSENNCPLKSENIKNLPRKPGVLNFFANCLKRYNEKPATHSESADDCQYCNCCKRKIDSVEVNKGAGDKHGTSNHDVGVCPCGKQGNPSIKDKIMRHANSKSDKISQKYPNYREKCCEQKQPLFEMKVDSVNYNIINKDEVTKKVSQLGSYEPKPKLQSKKRKSSIKHSKSCTCCKCINKKKGRVRSKRRTKRKGPKEKKVKKSPGAKITIPAKGPSNISSAVGKLFPMKLRTPAKPCICGSIECAKELKRLARGSSESKKTVKGKGKEPCVCGSPICNKEAKKIKKVSRKKEELLCKCRETIAKRKAKIILMNERKKDLERRLKEEHEKDEVRKRKRIKRNKELEHRLKKHKNSSDVLLAADSLIDVGKLGISTAAGMLRSTAKAVFDPKVAYENLKCKKSDTDLVMKRLQKTYVESDAAATARRLKMRCLFMKNVQKVRQKLDEYPVTHFIMHIADRDAKTRQFKRKPKRRRREPLDFECSLYMASLRRRPYLCVYYKCPWFYPHFITMLNVWKQFTDIMLFLLAAVVWSPCILCMEGCRAILCCFFCTG